MKRITISKKAYVRICKGQVRLKKNCLAFYDFATKVCRIKVISSKKNEK